MSRHQSPSPTTAVEEDAVTFHLSRQDLLSLQVQALLDASDDVDLSAEVAEELLSCLSRAIKDEEQRDTSAENNSNDPPESQDRDDDEGVDIVALNGEVDIRFIFDPFGKAQGVWTKQEVKRILHHLKERGSSSFVAEYVIKCAIPIPKLLNAFGMDLCPELLVKSAQTLKYILQVGMSTQLRKREKLPQHNSIADALQLIRDSQRILILTGAGISVSCGIPDFRSRNGIYAMLKDRGEYDMDDPQQMFDIDYFRENPAVFYQIYPSNFVPSPCHRFIKSVEEHGKLLRNYTQNIDTLETLVGVERVLQCHGSFATASCLVCRRQVLGKEIETEIMTQQVPLCSVCNVPEQQPPPSVKKKKGKKGKKEWELSDSDDDRPPPPVYPPHLMKASHRPDITFFGEKLNDVFDRSLAEDRDKVDLLLVIGTSLKVSPVADILSHLPHSIPQILINKTPIHHINPDIVLLGNADEIVLYLSDGLGWELPPSVPDETDNAPRMKHPGGSLKRKGSSDSCQMKMPTRVGNRLVTFLPHHGLQANTNTPSIYISHVWLFEGAEGGKWVDEVQERYREAECTPSRRPSPGSITSQGLEVRATKKTRLDA